jgi:hypothetical protein
MTVFPSAKMQSQKLPSVENNSTGEEQTIPLAHALEMMARYQQPHEFYTQRLQSQSNAQSDGLYSYSMSMGNFGGLSNGDLFNLTAEAEASNLVSTTEMDRIFQEYDFNLTVREDMNQNTSISDMSAVKLSDSPTTSCIDEINSPHSITFEYPEPPSDRFESYRKSGSLSGEASNFSGSSTKRPSRSRSGSMTTNMSDGTARGKLNRIRERNRISARKCRQRKKGQEIDLEMRVDELRVDQDDLLKEVKDLQYELMELQLQCIDHKKCDLATKENTRHCG